MEVLDIKQKTNLSKKILLLFPTILMTFLFCQKIYAENSSTYCKPGFYAGISAGIDDTSYTASDVFSEAETKIFNTNPPGIQYKITPPVYNSQFVVNSINDKGFAGRLFAGYQFNPHFAIEAGYTQFHKTDFSGTGILSIPPGDHITSSSFVEIPESLQTMFDGEITENAFDAVGVATYPLQNGFGIYAKAGLALITANEHINETRPNPPIVVNTNGVISYLQNVFLTKSTQAIRPTYSVGLSYSLPKTSLSLDASFMQILGGGNIPKANLLSLGISEKFA